MAFFSGPSKSDLVTMAQGVAGCALQIKLLESLSSPDRQAMAQSLESDGKPTSIRQLTRMAASVISEQKMGWLKRNQFLGAIQGSLVVFGFDNSDAAFIKNQIEMQAS